MRRALVAIVYGAISFCATPLLAQAVSWDLPLRNGWNLIALPIEPADPAVGSVFAGLIGQGALEAVWSHDATTGEWSAFVVTGPVPGLPAIVQMKTGRGYWVKVVGNPILTITGADPLVPAASLSELQLGWNLVSTSALEAKPYDRVFVEVPVLEIWTYDALAGAFKGVVLPPTGVGPATREDFKDLAPDRGYWVLIDPALPGAVPFGPDLDTSVPGDVDVMPLLPAAGPGLSVPWTTLTAGDEDIGGDGFYDSPLTQRALTFHDVSTQRVLTLINSGLGVLSYTATIDDDSALCGAVPSASLDWLYFREEDPLTAEPFDLTTVSGSVATESATLSLSADRSGLTPGLYCAAITIATNSVAGDIDDAPRHVLAYIEIPPLEGDYEFVTEIDTINGNAADTAAPEFFVSLYSDADGTKAIVDAKRTLLVPRNVRMTGAVYQDATNRFILSGSFALPADDPANPYDTELRRDITFVARRPERSDPAASGLGPLDFVGEYGETIRGPLGDANPIFLSGTLRGRRVAPEPSVLDGTLAQSLAIRAIPDGGTVEYVLNVNAAVLITKVEALLNITHSRPIDLWIRLEPPAGLGVPELTLRRAGDGPVGAISFEKTETAVDDLQVLSGMLSTGQWTLRIEDEVVNGQAGQVNSAAVRLSGTSVVNITGHVSGVGAGATVFLTGCGLSLTTATDGAEAYRFDNLIDCAYRITVQADGFEPQSMHVAIGPGAQNVVVDFDPMGGPPFPETHRPLPCEEDAVGDCTGLRFQALTTSAGAGARLPNAELRYVMDAGTFDLDRPPFGEPVHLEDTLLFSAAENPVTLTNACVTSSDPGNQGSTCVGPGDGVVDPAVGANSMRATLAIGGAVIGRSVRGSLQISMGANP